MTLVVPRSNADPGRAARTPAVATNQIGALATDLGETMLAVGTAVETDRLDREMQRLQVDMTKDLNDLRLQTLQIGDPDAAEAAWASGVHDLRGQYETGVTDDGRPRLDPNNAERFGLAFDDLSNRHAFSLGARTVELRNAQRQASYMRYTQAGQHTYATGDAELRSGVLEDLDAMIAADLASGRIDAAEAERRRQQFRAEGDNARAIQMIGADPEAFQQARKNQEFLGLEADVLARYDAQAAGAVTRRDKKIADAADKAAKEQDRQIGDRLSAIIDVASAGQPAVDEAFLKHPDVMGHEKWGEAQAAISLRDEGVAIEIASPAELRQMIAAEKSTPKAHKYQTERLKVLEQAQAAHMEGYAKDMVAYSEQVGLDVPTLPQFDQSDPASYGQAVRARVAWAEQMLNDGYSDAARVFSNAERDALTDLAGIESDPEARAALSAELSYALTGASTGTVGSLGLDPVFTYVGDLQTAGAGSRQLAIKILRGQQVIDQGNVTMPPASHRIDEGHSVLQEVFADMPRGEQIEATVRAATDAHYASVVRRNDPAGDIDGGQYRKSLHEVLGGIGDTGGIQEIRGVATLLPPGVSIRSVETALDRLPGAWVRGTHGNKNGQLVPNLTVFGNRLRRISGGQLPTIGGAPMTPDSLDDMQISAVGQDQYIFVAKGYGDQWFQINDENNAPFVFSLRDLLKEVAQ